MGVSTHDLTKRSTRIPNLHLQQRHRFNSRPHEEVDRILSLRKEDNMKVSTHDLTKRSTIMDAITDIGIKVSTHDLTKRSTSVESDCLPYRPFQLTTSRRGRQQFLRKKFSFQNHFLCSLHIIYSYYINTIFFSTLFLAKSSFFLVRIL